MNRDAIERIFVIAVFAVAYAVIAKGVSLTGFAIHLPEFPSEVALPEETNYVVVLSPGMNLEIRGLDTGSTLRLKDGANSYSLTILRLVQDFDTGEEYMSVLVSPGDKRLRIAEGQSDSLDFNNDGQEDALLSLTSISRGEATIRLVSP